MARALVGAAELAGGIVLAATGNAEFGFPLLLSGASMEMAEIGHLLQSDPGQLVTSRQSAAPRRVIYGTQRVGGIEVYESTTGSSYDQYNMVVVFSGHAITNFVNLYLDGREVHWGQTAGYTTRNGIGFGGGADGKQYIGPDGHYYTFDNAISGHRGVYVEARYGDQPEGDYMTSLTAQDSSAWGPSGDYAPTLYGCAYLFLKLEYNSTDFPSKPSIRATIRGKAVYDPRTGETAYSENPALIWADLITNTEWGLGQTYNVDAVIAAANVCDEQVYSYGAAASEARYSCNYTFTMDKQIGSVISDVLSSMAGRMAYVGGEWYVWPATFYGASASFTSDQLIAPPEWSSQRKFRDKSNRVQGTYLPAVYPYSVAGNYYDNDPNKTGTENTFGFAYVATSYPTYACDATHGYAANQYLTEDKNVTLPLTLDLPSVISISQAQRLAKIALLRNRAQGSGTLTFGPEAWMIQPNDTILYTDAKRGWSEKLLEVTRVDTSIQPGSSGANEIRVQLTVQETSSDIYVWNQTDELTPYDVAAFTPSMGAYTAAPTGLVLTSSAATALQQPDGSVTPRIQLTWDTPADVRVTSIQVQSQITGATTWKDEGTCSVDSNIYFIPAVAGSTYDVRIRSLNASGATSDWLELDGFTASLVLNTLTGSAGYGQGSLISEAYTGGTAAIWCEPFTAEVGLLSLSIFPSGPVTITTDGTIGGSGGPLQQQTLYYVFYRDPTYAGGDVTPTATTNKADFAGKMGYFLIDSIITQYVSSSGTGSKFYPASSADKGSRSTQNAAYAYDGDLSTSATISGSETDSLSADGADTQTSTYGDLILSGWPAVSLSAASTLTIVASAKSYVSGNSSAGQAKVTVNIGSSSTVVQQWNATTAQATYTANIPANTPLNTITVEVAAYGGSASVTVGEKLASSIFTVSLTEVYIQQ